jgi:hypothetical protein
MLHFCINRLGSATHGSSSYPPKAIHHDRSFKPYKALIKFALIAQYCATKE